MDRVSKQRRHIQRLSDAASRLPLANDNAESAPGAKPSFLLTINNIDLSADVTVSDDNNLYSWGGNFRQPP